MKSESEIRDRIADYEQRRQHYDQMGTREGMDRSHETTLLINILEWVLLPSKTTKLSEVCDLPAQPDLRTYCAAGKLTACPKCGGFYVKGLSFCDCADAEFEAEKAAEDAALPADLRGGPNSDLPEGYERTGTVCRICKRGVLVNRGGDVFCPECGFFPEIDDESEIEACPGCGCKPGDGLNPDCNHPDGCGFFRAENIATGQDFPFETDTPAPYTAADILKLDPVAVADANFRRDHCGWLDARR